MRRLLSILLFVCFASFTAYADNTVNLLIDSLKKDSSFKVRAKAAEIIGKKGDASAIPALIEALNKDANEAVRATAATALANLGATSNNADAAKALKTASEKDSSSIVRAEAAKALAKFPAAATPAPAGGGGGYVINDVYLEIGKFTNNTKVVDPDLLTQFQKLLAEELATKGKKVSAAPAGKKTLTLDGTIKKIEAKVDKKGDTTLTVAVSVIVTREKAFLASFEQSGDIGYEGKLSASDESDGRKTLMEALVPATYSDINKNLSRWK
jgi:hypothetical protein